MKYAAVMLVLILVHVAGMIVWDKANDESLRKIAMAVRYVTGGAMVGMAVVRLIFYDAIDEWGRP